MVRGKNPWVVVLRELSKEMVQNGSDVFDSKANSTDSGLCVI